MPTNFFMEKGITSMPTMVTMVPVTSAGKKARILTATRENNASNMPATKVMPKISGSPPALPAMMDAERKAGPLRRGHRYPEPTGPLFSP